MPSTSNTTESEWQWNPYKVLGIFPERTDFFCVGRAVSKGNARCRKRIDTEDIHDACIILNNLATEGPEDPKLQRRLHTLAQLTLCKDWHQDQRWQVVQNWTAVVQEWMNEKGEVLVLQKEAQARQKKISQLGTRLEEQDQELKTSRSTCAHQRLLRYAMEDKFSETTKRLNTKCQEYEELQAQVTESKEFGSQMEAKWKSAQKMVEVANRRLTESAEEAETYANDLQIIIDRGAKEIQDLRKELENAQIKAEEESSGKWEAWDLERIEQQQELEKLQKDLIAKEAVLKMTNDELQKKVAQRKLDSEQAIGKLQILDFQIRRLRAEGDESAKRATNQQRRLQRHIKSLQHEVQKRKEENQNLENDVETLRIEHSNSTHEFQQSLDASTAQIDRLKTETREAKNREEALQQDIKQLQTQFDTVLADSKAEGELLQAEFLTLQVELSKARHGLDESTTQTKFLQSQLEHTKDEFLKAQDDQRKTVEHLESVLEVEEKKSQGLACDVERISREKESLADDVEEIKRRLNELNPSGLERGWLLLLSLQPWKITFRSLKDFETGKSCQVEDAAQQV